MTPYRLSLDYALPAGWRAPYLEALQKGQAMARRCDPCGAVSFPPMRICPCGSQDGDWIPLNGRAEILWRTDGADGAFALARFDGANRMATVRLSRVPLDTRFARLGLADGPLPHLCLIPLARGAIK